MYKRPEILLILALSVAACAKEPPRVASVEGVRNARAILVERLLKEADSRVTSIRGMAKALLVNRDGDRQTDVAILVERPEKIRADAMDNIADVWAAAGTDGMRLWLWLPQKGKLYRGNATAGNLRKLADFDWGLADITSIIAGLVPGAGDAELVEINKRDRHYRLGYKPLHIFVDEKKRHPIRLIRYKPQSSGTDAGEEGGEVQYEVNFSDWRNAGGIEFPGRIEVFFPGRSSRLSIEYKDVEFNAHVDSSLFKPETVWRATKTIEMK
jgi:hypothetical protein